MIVGLLPDFEVKIFRSMDELYEKKNFLDAPVVIVLAINFYQHVDWGGLKKLCLFFEFSKIVILSSGVPLISVNSSPNARCSFLISKSLSGAKVYENFLKIFESMGFHCNKNISSEFFNLSRRQLQLVCLLQDGYSNKKISEIFGTSERTVKAQLYKLYKKLNALNRVGALNYARDAGFVD